MQTRQYFILLMFTVAFACGDDTSNSTPDGPNMVGFDDMGMGGATGGVGTQEVVRERLSYVKQTSVDGETKAELHVFDFDANQEINLSSSSQLVDCLTRQCSLSPNQDWVGWLEMMGAGGFRLRAAPVDKVNNRILDDQVIDVADNVDAFDFGLDVRTTPPKVTVVYSQVDSASAATKDILVRPLEACTDCAEVIGTVNANGGFRVTEVDGLFILIETTISSMTIRLFNLTTGSQQEIAYFGAENMTGSQFSANHPIGLSPDSTFLTVFTRVDFLWKINRVEARPEAPAPMVHELFETETSRSGTCMRDGNYFFQNVIGDPIFSADSQHVYFLVSGECNMTASENPTNRPDFEILRIGQDVSGPVENVSQIAHNSSWTNHGISTWSINGDGTKLVFDGERPTNASSKSLWLIDLETGEYDCSQGRARPGIDGIPRCEFVFDERSNAQVSFQSLKFQTVTLQQ